jgi:hypothetical protein
MPPPTRHRVRRWLRAHWLSLLIGTAVIVAVGLVHAIGYDRFPGRGTDDEGTYVSQAWAVQYWHAMAHYTYWYDHPPFGWITMAAYNWATNAFERLPDSVTVGREFMISVKVVSAAMIYLLARRLGYHRLMAAGAVLLFGLSPLAVVYQRMVYLDNIAVMWALAALALAASPRRSLAAAAGSAACFSMAILTKETIVVLLPALFLLVWQQTSPATRRYTIALFLTVLGMLVFSYPLYAILKNELFEGPGHVSLIWTIKWQLFNREASGSLLDPSSETYSIARSWVEKDPLLLGAGAVLAPIALLIRRCRAVALALSIQIVMTFRNGYLPFPYVIGLLPFAALTVAGVADWLCKGPAARGWLPAMARMAGTVVVVGALAVSVHLVGPAWERGVHQATTEDDSQPYRDALAYVVSRVPRGSILLVDNNMWTDLVRHGFNPNPVWFYKLDLDPTIRAKYQNGWRDFDFIVLSQYTATTLGDLPMVREAIDHSEVVADFGNGAMTVRRVVKEAPTKNSATGPANGSDRP